jgi:diguanylate cyclase (GGDEF)-like protein/PAS domain S-box-containing protein
MVDITGRKEAEEALKESEERYRVQSRELALLHQVRSALAQKLDLPAVFYEVVEATAEVYGYTQVSAYMLEGEDLLLQHQVGYERVIERIPMSDGVCGRTVRTGQPVLLEDVRTDPSFLGAIGGITSEICVPLFDEDEAVGCFNVESTGGVKLTQKDLRLMVALGEHVSLTISRAKLHTRVRNSEEYFRALTQNSSDIVTLLRAVGTVRYQSPSVERILGYRPEEMVGKNVFDYVHPDDLERVEMAFAEGLIDPKRRPSVEYRCRHKDGSWVWLESVGTNLLDDPGVGEYVVNSRNVTERKGAEERLREAEERYRNLVEQIPAVTYIDRVTDGLDEPLYTSPQIERMLGYTPEEWQTEKLWPKRLHPEDRERILAADERFEKGEEERFGEEYRLLAKDGSVVWVREEAVVVRGEGGEPLYWQGVIFDTTERKEAEDVIRRSEASLTQSQRIAHLGTWEWDVRSDEVRWSDETYRIYGFAARQFVPTLEVFLDVVHPDDRDLLTRTIDATLREGKPYDVEHRIVRPDGEVRVVHRQAEVVRGEKGEALRMIGTVHDITERKEAEEALQKSESSLAAAQRIAHIGNFEYSVQEDEARWSDELYRIFGFSPQQFVPTYKTFWKSVHPDDRDLIKGSVREALYAEKQGGVDYRIVRSDGEVRVVRSDYEVVRDASNQPVKLVGTVHEITERQALEEQLQHQAFHDPLTDLPNRQLLLDRLGQALRRTRRRRRRGRRVAILFMDLDDFKSINDSLGHEAGDLLLVMVAARLKRCLRPEDTLARFGGDEFVVLLEDVDGPEEAVRVAERVTDGLRGPFVLDGRELYARASIGIALGEARTESPEDLLRDADTAMYEAKGKGLGYRVFDPAMHERVLDRLGLENDLRMALEREEFRLFYQPKVRLKEEGTIAEVEALLRWEHPHRGLLLPDEFVPLAEQTGLIVPIGRWVLKETCRRVKGWQDRYPKTPPLVACVNVSAGQLRYPALLDDVGSVLRESGIEARSLALEITESALVKDMETSTTLLRELREEGVRFALDDFGSEYSSLSYLMRLPVDFVKIDKSFVWGLGKDPKAAVIVEAIISLAHSLGLEAVGEGVESAEQLESLGSMGCDLAQGYHLARPMPGDELDRLLGRKG